MNLYLFPEKASIDNGYSIAVMDDYKQFTINRNDILIWNSKDADFQFFGGNGILIKRDNYFSLKRIMNIINRKHICEVSIGTLSDKVKNNGTSFETIFCGDIIFYRALRKLFPKHKLVVRFHNCFARISDRNALLRVKLNRKMQIGMALSRRLELEIFRDLNVEKIFISEEDMVYYNLMTGRKNDARVWCITPKETVVSLNRKPIRYANKLVWYGGLEAHKIASIKWFINDIFPIIRNSIPDIEFHLWGKRTEIVDNPSKNIFGHGYYKGRSMPFSETALYVNPDIIGGGVKIKLKTYFEAGIPFITTPFGYEGYSANLIDNQYCYCVEPELWAASIIAILKGENRGSLKALLSEN
jgi:hypothetical protein